MYVTSLKFLILMWQYGLVDTFTVMNVLYNAGAQYGAVVIASMADGNITNFPEILLEPIAGLGVNYKFVPFCVFVLISISNGIDFCSDFSIFAKFEFCSDVKEYKIKPKNREPIIKYFFRTIE